MTAENTPTDSPAKRPLPPIDAELHRRLKIRAAEERRTMRELLEELGWQYLGGKPVAEEVSA